MPTTHVTFDLESGLRDALDREAKQSGQSAEYLAQRAIAQFVMAQDHKRKTLDEAFAEADKGVFVSGEAVDAWIASWDTENELPMPEPDIFPASAIA